MRFWTETFETPGRIAYRIVRHYVAAGRSLVDLTVDKLLDALPVAEEIDDQETVAAIREAFAAHIRIKG